MKSVADAARDCHVDPKVYCKLQRVRITIKKFLTFDHYECQEVRDFELGGVPNISRSGIKCGLVDYFLCWKDALTAELREIKESSVFPRFNIMVDNWSNKICHVACNKKFFGIRINYIDNLMRYQTKLLAFVPYCPSYSMRMQEAAQSLLASMTVCILEEFGLSVDDIVSITSDAGPDMMACSRRQLKKEHVWCFSHMLNRVLNQAIGKDGPVKGLIRDVRDLVNTINLSDYNSAFYSELDETTDLQNDVAERWTSIVNMIESVIKNFDAIQQTYAERNILEELNFRLPTQKAALVEVYGIVKKVQEIITVAQGNTYNTTVQTVLLMVDLLNSGIVKDTEAIKIRYVDGIEIPILPCDLTPEAKLVRQEIINGLKNRLIGPYRSGRLSKLIDLAVFFHPNLCTSLPHIEAFLSVNGGDNLAIEVNQRKLAVEDAVKEKMRAVWRSKNQPRQATPEPIPRDTNEDLLAKYCRTPSSTPPPLSLSQSSLSTSSSSETLEDTVVNEEYHKYLITSNSLPLLDLKGKAYSWWKENQHLFPLLAEVAKGILCITVGSGAIERDFCLPGLIFTKIRGNLDPVFGSILTMLNINFEDLPDLSKVQSQTTQDNINQMIPKELFYPLESAENQ